MTLRALPALALAAALGAGCSGAAETAPESAPAPPPPVMPAEAMPEPATERVTQPATPEAPGESPDDLEALYWERVRASRTFTQADVDYMTGMIGHHAQALIMADLAMTNDAGPGVRRLAARIDNAQRDEIETMQRWLRQRGQPVPVPTVEGTVLTITMEAPPEASGAVEHAGMDHSAVDHSDMGHEGTRGGTEHEGARHGAMDHGQMDHGQMDHGAMDHGAMGHDHMGHDHAGMPGMLTQSQLDTLAAARGLEFDRLFLTYMIAHHGGAVVMTDDLFAQDGAAQDDGAFKMASEIQVDQRTEIARMQQMLRALPPAFE